MYKLIAVSSALIGVAHALTVNTPAALVQCQPALLSWSDGTAPYYLAIIPGGQPSAAALENLPTQQGNTYTWTVDQASGQSVTLKITDSTGAINYSDKVTIQAGTSTSCSSSGGSVSSAAGSSSSSSAAATGSSSTAATRQPLTSSSTKLTSATTSAAANSKSSASSAVSAATSATSGVAAAAAAASSSAASTSASHSGATSLKAATGLLLGALVFCLAA